MLVGQLNNSVVERRCLERAWREPDLAAIKQPGAPPDELRD